MEHLPAVILFVAIAAITPGPNNIMIMSSGVNFGVRASLPHLLGICLGVPMVLLTIGLGAGNLFQRLPWTHEVIKLVGLGYLCYLAYRIANSAPGGLEGGRSKPFTFFEATIFQWVNPKTWMMGTSAIATYTSLGTDMPPQILMIVLVFFALTWPSAGIWLLFGTGLKKILAKPSHQRVFNWVMAALLLVSMQGVVRELLQTYF